MMLPELNRLPSWSTSWNCPTPSPSFMSSTVSQFAEAVGWETVARLDNTSRIIRGWSYKPRRCRRVRVSSADRLTWLDIDDEPVVRPWVLTGSDVDLADDATRTINRCRDAFAAINPALER